MRGRPSALNAKRGRDQSSDSVLKGFLQVLSVSHDSVDFLTHVELIFIKIGLLILLFITLSKLIWNELAPLIRELVQSG